MNKLAIIILTLFLISCTTIPTPVITNSCNPPAELMTKTSKPKKITETVLTEQQILEFWTLDVQKLNDVIDEENALIDHINTYCKEKVNK